MKTADQLIAKQESRFYNAGDLNNVLGQKGKVINDERVVFPYKMQKDLMDLLKRWKFTEKSRDKEMVVMQSKDKKQELLISVDHNDDKVSVTVD